MSKKILITGANGYLGGKITRYIIEKTNYDVIAVSSTEEKVSEMMQREQIQDFSRVQFLSNAALLSPETELLDVYGAVHLAFARRNRPASDIAASLDYAANVFRKLASCGIDRVINMSSQGIYGGTSEIRTESTPPAPMTHYTMAKYASEILFNTIMKDCALHTNLRLDLVAQSQNIILGLCRSAKAGCLNLKGGKQVFSFIDGEDVPCAVLAMLDADGPWEESYNVGWNEKRFTLMELAELFVASAKKQGYATPTINFEEADIALWSGMNSLKFMEKTGWSPRIILEDTILRIMK